MTPTIKNGRIGKRQMSAYELLGWMIHLYEAAWAGNACWHEAEYYTLLSRRACASWCTPWHSPAGIA